MELRGGITSLHLSATPFFRCSPDLGLHPCTLPLQAGVDTSDLGITKARSTPQDWANQVGGAAGRPRCSASCQARCCS